MSTFETSKKCLSQQSHLEVPHALGSSKIEIPENVHSFNGDLGYGSYEIPPVAVNHGVIKKTELGDQQNKVKIETGLSDRALHSNSESGISTTVIKSESSEDLNKVREDILTADSCNDSFLPELSDDDSSSDDSDSESDEDSYIPSDSEGTSVTGTSEVSFGSSREVAAFPYFNITPIDDDFLFCEECEDWIEDSCFEHSLPFVENNEGEESHLPECLEFRQSNVSLGLIGVFCKDPIPKCSMFGPLRGAYVTDFVAKSMLEMDYLWEVKNFRGKSKYILQQQKSSQCNWLYFVRFANNKHEQNLVPLQFKGEVYYKALVDIPGGSELLSFRGEGLPWTRSVPLDSVIAPESRKLDRGSGVQYSCPHCPAVFSNKSHFRCHLNGVRHNPLDDVICRQCSFVAKKRSELRSHVYLKHDLKPHKCPLCPARFKRSGRVKPHVIKVHTGDKESGRKKDKECPTCGKKFVFKHHLRNHQMTHGEKRFECSVCGQKLSSEVSLKNHLDAKHSDMKFPCEKCGKELNSKLSLRAHMLNFHSREAEVKRSRPKNEYGGRRKKTDEERSASLTCPFCGAVFSYPSARSRHEYRAHPGLKEEQLRDGLIQKSTVGKFKCSYCPRGFKTLSDLKYHMMRHTGQFPFKCSSCGKGYTTQSEVNKHLKRSNCNKATGDTS